MSWDVIDLDGKDSVRLLDGSFDMVVDKCCLDCVLCETNGADYIAELTRVLKRKGVLCIVSLHGPDFLLPLLEAPELAFNVSYQKIRSSTALTVKDGLDLTRNMPNIASNAEDVETSVWSDEGVFAPPDDYIDSTNMYVCRPRRTPLIRKGSAVKNLQSENTNNKPDTEQRQYGVEDESETSTCARAQAQYDHDETQAIEQFFCVDKDALHARYDSILDEWFRIEAPMLTPARKKTIEAAYAKVVAEALDRERIDRTGCKGKAANSQIVVDQEEDLRLRNSRENNSTTRGRVPMMGQKYNSQRLDANDSGYTGRATSEGGYIVGNALEDQSVVDAGGKECTQKGQARPQSNPNQKNSIDACCANDNNLASKKIQNATGVADNSEKIPKKITSDISHMNSAQNRPNVNSTLCIAAVYDLLFTSLEKEHYAMDQFVHDYDVFRLVDRKSAATTVKHARVMCGCVSTAVNIKQGLMSSCIREVGDHARGLNLTDAIAFLDLMQ
ncbi:hypothetical protein SARC_10189 [Sphaeroforma arctica JP610]|uniref:Uncharacterized protein n=1 Tax=Sphaeroforma arctica JP610 TaxID=667725 RepID=A0A0L0FKQ3_9EUKA|nr:hypothetical protein SARC_10189 [Sphaeroforma arctica JP610]KNC77350.1 hypothetical protein SARC_10189 [Sphaeroforma arctica JP610]|eukprot:XP_014151252.1 hypothetical protein SARC_10189 [Sphaeroforma arctica JP610]